MPFASRKCTSPLFITLGYTVRDERPDANDHVLLNTGSKLITGLWFEGDCVAHLARCTERLLHAALSCGMSAAAVESFLEDKVSDMNGPYAGRIFDVGLLTHVRQQMDFQYSDEYRLLGLKQFLVDAVRCM